MRTFVRTQLWPAIAILLAFTVITGLIYPAIVTAAAQVAFPNVLSFVSCHADHSTSAAPGAQVKSWLRLRADHATPMVSNLSAERDWDRHRFQTAEIGVSPRFSQV